MTYRQRKDHPLVSTNPFLKLHEMSVVNLYRQILISWDISTDLCRQHRRLAPSPVLAVSMPPLYAPYSLSWTKLPLLRVLLVLRPPNRRLLVDFGVLSLRAPPPKQKRTVERKKQATAAHSKPKAYLPMCADWPFPRKLSRPFT